MYKLCHQLIGFIKAYYIRIRYYKKIQQVLSALMLDLKQGEFDGQGNRFFIMVGFSASGKETLRREHSVLKECVVIDTNKIHDLLNRRLSSLQDDNTIAGPAYWVRQFLTLYVRRVLHNDSMGRGLPILSDSCNLTRSGRRKYILLAISHGYTPIIVWVTCSEKILLSRLEGREDVKIKNGEKPAWIDLYQDIQKARFNPPDESEAKVVKFNSDCMSNIKSLVL